MKQLKYYDNTFFLKETEIYGLSYEPSFEQEENNKKEFLEGQICLINVHLSECNIDILRNYIKLPSSLHVMEIGVEKEHPSFLSIFRDNRIVNSKYLGVDIEDKSGHNRPNENILTIKSNSSNFEYVSKYISEHLNNKIDLLFIDGYHSVNQIIDDWKYVKFLSKKGVVILHDTNFHPGPVLLFDTINENIFYKEKKCISKEDWGMSVITRK